MGCNAALPHCKDLTRVTGADDKLCWCGTIKRIPFTQWVLSCVGPLEKSRFARLCGCWAGCIVVGKAGLHLADHWDEVSDGGNEHPEDA